MAKPVILAVDDDELVLNAVSRDLRRRYADHYQVVGASSGAEALGILNEMLVQGEAAALLVADQRMPEMNGVDLLENSLRLFPDAKRVLLTAYADTEAAIAAINRAEIHYYILKPWDPPEERLFPVTDDLLDDWRANYRPVFAGVRVVGDRWSSEAHRLKAFLASNQVPYQSIDVETDERGRSLLEAVGATVAELPVVILPDGGHLVRPTQAELAAGVGLHTRPQLPTYDLVIVGCGPAGMAAAVYGASEGLKTLLVEREAPGGQAGQSARIENYLGFPTGLSGADLTRRAVTQAKRFGVEMLVSVEATALERLDPFRLVRFSDGTQVNAKSMVIATGVSYRLLPAEGADRLAGAGLFYGASALEASTYRDQEVVIVGAGNSAGQAAVYMSGFAGKVTILVRGAALAESMSAYLVDRIGSVENIAVRYQAEITALFGEHRLEQVAVRDLKTGATETLSAAAVFVFIGQAPRTEWLAEVVERDPQGFILTGNDCQAGTEWAIERRPLPLESSVPGVFVAGDVRAGSIKRVASATGEGAMAVRFIHEHLASL